MKLLNSFFGLLLITLLAACSSTNGGHPNNARFGTWNKVSATRGDYVGISNLPGRAALGGIHPLRGAADTTAVDTSYIDNAGQLSLKIAPVNFTDANYDFTLTLTDSGATFPNYHSEFHYISDSTAFVVTNTAHIRNRPDYNSFELRMYINCNKQQAGKEYVTYKSTNRDSTKSHVYKVRVDGMYKIVDNLLVGCH